MCDKNLSDEETISYLINILNERFDELFDSRFKTDKFVLGELAAYSDCYNMISAWSDAASNGFDSKYISARTKQ